MIVGMAKSTSINLRITQEFRKEMQQLADYRGLSLSSLAHSLLVKQMRLERSAEPEAFESEHLVNDLQNKPRQTSISPKGIPLQPHSNKKMPFVGRKQEQQRKKKTQ